MPEPLPTIDPGSSPLQGTINFYDETTRHLGLAFARPKRVRTLVADDTLTTRYVRTTKNNRYAVKVPDGKGGRVYLGTFLTRELAVGRVAAWEARRAAAKALQERESEDPPFEPLAPSEPIAISDVLRKAGNKTGVLGVSRQKSGRFRAEIRIEGTLHRLGTHADVETAAGKIREFLERNGREATEESPELANEARVEFLRERGIVES
jgi:hypothetical protein